jgi:CelD/BcsL family acetyltransferase involved in cellulose biosynthesis
MFVQNGLPSFHKPFLPVHKSTGGIFMTGPAHTLDLSIFTRLSEARPAWQQLKAASHGNPYQSPQWLETWQTTLGKTLGVEPRIVVGRKDGRAVVILPLGLEKTSGLSTLVFLGHQHGNQNTGYWDPGFYRSVSEEEIRAMLTEVCNRAGADLLRLENMPETWQGRRHPLVLAGSSGSPSPVFARALPPDFDTLFQETHSKSSRKNLLRKERNLQAAGDYRIVRAESRSDRERGLAAFLQQREYRAGAAGIPNAFSSPQARDFLAGLLGLGPETGDAAGLMDLWYLEAGGVIRSTYLCIEDDETLYAYSNSIAHDDMMANSPGLVLIRSIIAHACASPHLQTLDLGLGEERYKTDWAEPVALMDSLLAVTSKGRAGLLLAAGRLRLKAAVRNSDLLWPLVRRIRKWKAGMDAPNRRAN